MYGYDKDKNDKRRFKEVIVYVLDRIEVVLNYADEYLRIAKEEDV